MQLAKIDSLVFQLLQFIILLRSREAFSVDVKFKRKRPA